MTNLAQPSLPRGDFTSHYDTDPTSTDEDVGMPRYATAVALGFVSGPDLPDDYDFFAAANTSDDQVVTTSAATTAQADAVNSSPPANSLPTTISDHLPAMVPEGDNPATLLNQVFAGMPAEVYFASATRFPNGGFVNTPRKTSSAVIQDVLAASAQGQDAYYAMAAFARETYIDEHGKPRFRTQINALGACSYWGDIDVGPDKARTGEGYATLESAWQALMAFCHQSGFPLTNLVVVSGSGLHAYWTLGQFRSKLDWEIRARKLKKLFRRHGLRVDPHRTADIASLLRPPGTRNYKQPGQDRPVYVIRVAPHVDPGVFDAALSLADGEDDADEQQFPGLGHHPRQSPLSGTDMASFTAGLGRDWPETPENIRLIKRLLASLTADRGYNGDPGAHQTPWYQLGLSLAYLESLWGWQGARELFADWSATCPERFHRGPLSGQAAIDQLFASYDPTRPDHCRITIGTLIKSAQDEGGWTWPTPDRTNDPDTALEVARTRAGATQARLDRLQGVLVLPSEHLDYDQAATKIFTTIAPSLTWFNRGGVLVEWTAEEGLVILTPEKFVSRLDKFGVVMKHRAGKSGTYLAESRCGLEMAKILLASEAARRYLPSLSIVSSTPVLIPDGTVLGHGYHPALGGVLVTGTLVVPDVTLATAVPALTGLLVDFNFVSPGDYARAIAALISPALAIGGMLPYPPAPDYAEADQSQAGKGYRHELVRTLYGVLGKMLAKRVGGVGSLDEDISAALMDGFLFVVLDNLRGNVNSAFLESILTNSGRQNVRVPHRPQADVDAKPISFQISSNGMESTPDLANRVSVCRILKQPPAYAYHPWPEGSLIDHVRAHQPFYLGCVYAIVGAWIDQGRPGIPCEHDRKYWAEPLNWIVQRLFGCGDLMAGHAAAKRQMGDPATSWLRQIALRLQEDGRFGETFTAQDLAELAIAEDLRITGAPDWGDRNPLALARRVGALMKQVFQGPGVTSHHDPADGTTDHLVVIDRIHIGRSQVKDYTVVTTGVYAGKRVSKTIPVYAFGPVSV